MNEKNVLAAAAYYKAMADKDLAALAWHLHPDVRLQTPVEELNGKEAVLAAAECILNFIKGIEIHAKFGSEDQAILT